MRSLVELLDGGAVFTVAGVSFQRAFEYRRDNPERGGCPAAWLCPSTGAVKGCEALEEMGECDVTCCAERCPEVVAFADFISPVVGFLGRGSKHGRVHQ